MVAAFSFSGSVGLRPRCFRSGRSWGLRSPRPAPARVPHVTGPQQAVTAFLFAFTRTVVTQSCSPLPFCVAQGRAPASL